MSPEDQHDEQITRYLAGENPTEDDLAFYRGWQPVTPVVSKDIEESIRVRRLIGARKKMCFQNAHRVVQELEGYANASYVEGIACMGGGVLVIEHGWVCRPDGIVIDPTLPSHEIQYFPGLEFCGRSGIAQYLATERGSQTNRVPFFYAFGWGGSNSPSYNEAWRQARSYVQKRYLEAPGQQEIELSHTRQG